MMKTRVVTFTLYLLLISMVLAGCSNRIQPADLSAPAAVRAEVGGAATPTINSSLSAAGEWVMEGYSPARDRLVSDSIPPPLKINQEFVIGGDMRMGSPVGIAGDMIFVESPKKMHALALESGQERWFYDTPGSYLSPAIAGNQLFMRAESGEDGYIIALQADTGLRVWQFRFARVGSEDGNVGGHVTSPVVVDGLVLVGASQAFHALQAEDGQQAWQFKTDAAITSSATVADDTIFFTDFDYLYALDLQTGQERWRFAHDSAATTLQFAPVVSGEQIITTSQNKIFALDRASGQEVWQKTLAVESAIPAGAGDGAVYIKSTNGLFALNAATGAELWSYQAVDYVSLPVITRGQIYLITRSGGTAQLRALDLQTGNEIWHLTNNRLANAAPVVAGGMVYVRTVDGSVLVFQAG